MAQEITLTIDGTEYVAVPRGEYLRLRARAPALGGAVDAVPFARASIGRALAAARAHAGLTQAELARKLGKAQPMVSAAEAGTKRVGTRYVKAVLGACGLPEDWSPPKRARGR